MSNKQHLAYRVKALEEVKDLNAVERSRKLKSIQVTESKISSRKSGLKKIIKESELDIKECNSQLERLRIQREFLEGSLNGDVIITEHAYLRFVERFLGVDLKSVHDQILKLSKDDKVQHGNTIITVFTDDKDHFNLAEREKL